MSLETDIMCNGQGCRGCNSGGIKGGGVVGVHQVPCGQGAATAIGEVIIR